MQKLYKREGRRFVPSNIQNNLGKYYDPINGFTTEKTDTSVGLCIISDFEKDVIMELKDKDEILTENKRLPTASELLLAFDKYQKELNLKKYRYYPIDNNIFTDKLGYAHGLLYLSGAFARSSALAADVHIGFRSNSIPCRIVRELKNERNITKMEEYQKCKIHGGLVSITWCLACEHCLPPGERINGNLCKLLS